jgi:hypothetical protein
MKSVIFSWLLMAASGTAQALCPPATTVFRCENITSSEIAGRPEDKVISGSYRVWLQGEESQRGLRIDGKASWNNGSLGESKLPLTSKSTSGLGSQELTVTDCEWRLNEKFAQQVLETYSNYPKVHDRYLMDLKNSSLTVSMPVGVKSFATFKLSCVAEEK